MNDAGRRQEGGLSGMVADAVSGNWVDTRAPEAAKPYLRLSRADRPIGTWLLFWPCVWGILLAALATGPLWIDLWLIAGCGAGAVLMRGAGCTWNDITDRDFDAQVARTRSRPLPSGAASVRGAMVWLMLQALVAFAILLTFNGAAIVTGIASLALVAIYPFAKRFTWWPQVFLGLAFNWGALLGWVAHTGGLSAAPVLLYLAGIAWTLFYDTIYAMQDIEDDALIGVKSTARLFGDDAPRYLALFAGLTVALILAAVWAAGAGWLAALGALGIGGQMAWQLSRLDPADPARCMVLFRSNRDGGALVALFFALALAV
ncbi:MAG: 4-hydroxybenzoate octaprenyltransferase [Shimia sp.]